MRDFLSVEREANAIRLKRSAFSGTFLLVEGTSDKKFYGNLIDCEKCQIVTVSGKPSSKFRVIQVLEILEKSNFQGVLAIIDADFDNIQTPPHKSFNLLRTDTHDLETMLLKSLGLEKVLREFGSEEKITKFNREIRQVLINAGLPIGYLRWISQLENLNLTFNKIKFTKFINDKTLKIDELVLIKTVKDKSQNFSLSHQDIQQKIISKRNMDYDSWQICCGHDLVEILSISLRKTIGTNKTSDIEPNKLEISLRIAYEKNYFCQTQLYLKICTWEKNNPLFKIL